LSSDVTTFYEKASAEESNGYDPKYFRALAGIVPKNSGIQIIYKDYHQDVLIASNMHWKWRDDAMALVKSYEYGITAISSEGGAAIKTLTTTRQEMIMQQQNRGPKPELWDKVLYGKEKFQGNE
jgi:hypothetical protein